LTRSTLALVALSGASILCIVLRFSEFIAGSVGDDAVYIEMARSMAEGRGPIIYLSEFRSYLPFAFPAGYPFLLSPIAWISPHSIDALQLVSLVLPLSVIPFYFICQQMQINRALTMSSIALILINPWIIAYSNRVLSEAPYTFFSYLALLVFLKWQDRPGPLSPLLLAVLIAIGLSASIRTVGLALILATLVCLLMGKKWSHLISLSLGVGLSMAPQWWTNRQDSGSIISKGYHMQMVDHAQNIGARLDFMLHNGLGYLNELPAALVPLFGNQVQSIANHMGLGGLYTTVLSSIGILLLTLISLGAWQVFRHHIGTGKIILLYLAFYTGAILNFSGWPSGIQLRLLVPMLPILYLLLVLGISYLVSRTTFPQWTLSLIIIAILTASVTHNLYRVRHSMRQSRNDVGRGFVDYSAGSAWIQAHTEPTDMIMARYPLERHIHFNRPFVGYPEEASQIESLPLKNNNVSFLFISPGNPNYPDQLDDVERRMKSMARAHPDKFQLAYEMPDKSIYIYQVTK
jgi:4-amino-4-deoxy-L-arabinose transferase-like glycosyltransferase